MISEYTNKQRSNHQGKLSYEEFEALCFDLKAKDVASTFKTVVSKKENLETLGGMSSQSAEGTTHSVRMEEQLAFSDWINSNIGHDVDLSHLLPIDGEGRELYAKIKDGILLCKIINHSCPDTIDERAINKKNLTVYREFENLTLALVSSQAIGCNIVNIDAHDLAKGKPHLVLGLLWQIIRIGLFSHITLDSCPGLASLLFDGERLEDLMKLSPEAILLRWVNHHLANAGVSRRCTNFQSDIVDSEVYSHLLKQIAQNEAGVTLEALRVSFLFLIFIFFCEVGDSDLTCASHRLIERIVHHKDYNKKYRQSFQCCDKYCVTHTFHDYLRDEITLAEYIDLVSQIRVFAQKMKRSVKKSRNQHVLLKRFAHENLSILIFSNI